MDLGEGLPGVIDHDIAITEREEAHQLACIAHFLHVVTVEHLPIVSTLREKCCYQQLGSA